MAYTTYQGSVGRHRKMDDTAYRSPAVIQFRAGQMVRVVNITAPEDGMGYEPTVRADSVEVHVSDPDAAVQVSHDPGPEAMARVYKRSADDAAFWIAMIAAPKDDLRRLVYADWLDERGDPAGSILRDNLPFTLHGWVWDGQGWEHRKQLRMNWRKVVEGLHGFMAQGAYRFLEDTGHGQSVARYTLRPQLRRGSDPGEWRRLSVSMDVPMPPFVNYLLLQLALARWQRCPGPAAARPSTPEAGGQPLAAPRSWQQLVNEVLQHG